MATTCYPLVSADDEWSPLRSAIVGREDNSCFPHAPPHMIAATMPAEHLHEFKPRHRFPLEVLQRAHEELEQLVSILIQAGVHIHRPRSVDWREVGGYTAAMARDGLLTVGNTVIESCYAWDCRRKEIDLAFTNILDDLEMDLSVKAVRAPRTLLPDTIYDGVQVSEEGVQKWAINNSRPAFDAADFMRFGKTLIGQLSNVTYQEGVEYLQNAVPEGYAVELLGVNGPHAMHIDVTILPLRKGLLIYNPKKVTEAALRKHEVLRGWELHAYPYQPPPRENPPRYMTSGWLMMNVLSLDEKRVIVEAGDEQFAAYLETLGMEPIRCPFQHVHSLGVSFHCATVDLVRQRT